MKSHWKEKKCLFFSFWPHLRNPKESAVLVAPLSDGSVLANVSVSHRGGGAGWGFWRQLIDAKIGRGWPGSRLGILH